LYSVGDGTAVNCGWRVSRKLDGFIWLGRGAVVKKGMKLGIHKIVV
jgi:hypothetical protein